MIIKRDVLDNIIAHAEKDAPIEACGYLAGANGRVTHFYPMANAEGREDHFSFDPMEQFAVHRKVRQEGLQIIAAYHSHPATPARPSEEDIRLAHDPNILYVIVSLLAGERNVKTFRIRQGNVQEEVLVVEDAQHEACEVDLAALKKVGMIQQKQKNYFSMRLHAVAGNFTSEQMNKVAEVAERFGRGKLHLSTRQGIEIHYVHASQLEAARTELESVGVTMGACGPRVRIVAGCPGQAICQWGVVDTEEIALYLDRTYFRQDTPHKFKLAVTGCAHNCAKATENDIGVMGGIEPEWVGSACIDCGLCTHICPTGAIEKTADHTYAMTRSKCINCSICTLSCPSEAWKAERHGFILWLGGTMGKAPRLATRVPGLIESKETLHRYIHRAIEYYRAHGRKHERFGHMIDRIGVEKSIKEITDDREGEKAGRSSRGHMPDELCENNVGP